MKPPSTALLRTFSPFWASSSLTWTARGCIMVQQCAPLHGRRDFSSTQTKQARQKGRPKIDTRITQIRYHLQHPLTPRPLRFSRTRALRHWTIHRAWQLYQYKARAAKAAELQAQYMSMYRACEALRLIDNNGLTQQDRAKLGVPEPPRDPIGKEKGSEEGRLYRIAMQKKGIWSGVPIEYARIQTETPPREGWNHAWTR